MQIDHYKGFITLGAFAVPIEGLAHFPIRREVLGWVRVPS